MQKITRIRNTVIKRDAKPHQQYIRGLTRKVNTAYDTGVRCTIYSPYHGVRNPTLQEVVEFLRSDKTDRMLYVPGSFMCEDFAVRIARHANQKGLRCGYVSIHLTDGTSHGCNVWNTRDKGLIFTDSTGMEYFDQIIHRDCDCDCDCDTFAAIKINEPYYCNGVDYDDLLVCAVHIIWGDAVANIQKHDAKIHDCEHCMIAAISNKTCAIK